jgi:hypothetical protein
LPIFHERSDHWKGRGPTDSLKPSVKRDRLL